METINQNTTTREDIIGGVVKGVIGSAVITSALFLLQYAPPVFKWATQPKPITVTMGKEDKQLVEACRETFTKNGSASFHAIAKTYSSKIGSPTTPLEIQNKVYSAVRYQDQKKCDAYYQVEKGKSFKEIREKWNNRPRSNGSVNIYSR